MRTLTAAILALAASPGLLSAQIDANGNGISDIYERHFNGGQLFGPTFTATADEDADGQNNLQESISGTDPLKFDPPEGHLVQTIRHVPATWGQEPGQSEPVLLTPEAFEIGWQTVAGKEYTLSFSPSLEGGTWLPVDYPIHSYFGGPILMGCIPDAGGGQMPDKLFWRVEARDVDQDGDGLSDYEEILFGTDPETPVTFTGIPDLWLTSHYPSAQGFDPDADDDSDGLTNSDESHHGTSPHTTDSDGDGTTDMAEVNQGSNPANNSDGGLPPEDPLEEVEFTVGGDYACWRMEIQGQGPRDTRLLRFASPAANYPVARTFKLQRNNKYEITLHRVGGYPDWYCWEASVGGKPEETTFDYDSGYYQLGARNENARFFSVAGHWLVDNRDGLLTSHLHSYYNDVATGLKAVLHPMEYKLCWETSNKANQVFNKTKKDDSTNNADVLEEEADATYAVPRNHLYLVADPQDGKFKISVDMGIPNGYREKTMVAAYDGTTKVHGSDTYFPVSADQPARMEIPGVATGTKEYEVKVGYDANENGLLDDLEASPIVVYTRLHDNSARHLTVTGISNSKFASHALAVDDNITVWGYNVPIYRHARAFLRIFRDTTPLLLSQEDSPSNPEGTAVLMNCFASPGEYVEWLTHNSGAPLTENGTAIIKEYLWDSDKPVASFLAESHPLQVTGAYLDPKRTKIAQFYAQHVRQRAIDHLANEPLGATVVFPRPEDEEEFYVIPGIHETESRHAWVPKSTITVGAGSDGGIIPDHARGVIGRGRILNHYYQFTVRKQNGGGLLPDIYLEEIRMVATLGDLYDFNYEDGDYENNDLACNAAALQLGHGNGQQGPSRSGGRIFRVKINIDHRFTDMSGNFEL